MGFGINVLLSGPSVPAEALHDNSLITVPCQVMPPLLTRDVLTVSSYLQIPYTVISAPSRCRAAVYFSAITVCIAIIEFVT